MAAGPIETYKYCINVSPKWRKYVAAMKTVIITENALYVTHYSEY